MKHLIFSCLYGFVALAGCDTQVVDLQNAVPRITWVAVVPGDADVLEVTLWVNDYEWESVDVAASWVVDGGAPGTGQAIVEAPGSPGLVGMSTRENRIDLNGQPNLVLWDVADVPAGSIRLVLTPTDDPYDSARTGGTFLTPAFDKTVGLTTPVLTEKQ